MKKIVHLLIFTFILFFNTNASSQTKVLSQENFDQTIIHKMRGEGEKTIWRSAKYNIFPKKIKGDLALTFKVKDGFMVITKKGIIIKKYLLTPHCGIVGEINSTYKYYNLLVEKYR